MLLKNVNMKLTVGKTTCIIGHNGSGKTTLLNIISGFIPEITNGYFEGFVKYNNRKLNFKDIDYVFQNSESSLFFSKVSDQLSTVDTESAKVWLKKFGMADKYDVLIKELSVGQRKIVSCISSLLSDRPICILDEPSTNLDDKNKHNLIDLIEERKIKKIILLVTHNIDFIKIADHLYKIKCNEVHKIKKPTQSIILKNTKIKKNKREIFLRITNYKYEFDNSNKYYCDKKIELEKNAIIGCIGKNGSGKTTLANYILKYNKKFVKWGFSKHTFTCAVMFQDFYKQLFQFSVEKEIVFGCNKKEYLFEKDDMLKKIGLYEKKHEDPRFLSDGQKRLLLIASLLMKKVDLLILDEPFDNIDFQSQKIIKKILLEYKKLTASTILILDQNIISFSDIIDQEINLECKTKVDKLYEEELINKDYKYLAEGLVHNVYEKNEHIYKIVKSNLPLFNVEKHFEKEFQCHSYLKQNGIENVSEIIQILPKGSLIKDYEVLIEKKIKGICYKENEIKNADIKKIIKFLIEVSQISVSQYGVLFDNDIKSDTMWNDYIKNQIKNAKKIINKFFSKDSNLKKIINNPANFIYNEESKFLIMDPNTENFIFTGKNFTAIDIDHPIGGDPLWQFACVYWHKPNWKKITNFKEIFKIYEKQILNYCILYGLNIFDFYEKNGFEIENTDINKIYELINEVKNVGK